MSVIQVFEISEEGYILGTYVKEIDSGGNLIEELPPNFVIVRPQDGLFRAKWTGTEWVEDKTQAEFEEDDFLESLTPTPEEIVNAEFEIKTLNILMEVGLI